MNKEYHDNEALKEAKKRTKKRSLLSPHFPGLKTIINIIIIALLVIALIYELPDRWQGHSDRL